MCGSTDPLLKRTSHKDNVDWVTCYFQYLVVGNTIMPAGIKSNTLSRYIQAVAEMIMESLGGLECDPQNSKVMCNLYPKLDRYLKEIQGREAMAEHREPLTKKNDGVCPTNAWRG